MLRIESVCASGALSLSLRPWVCGVLASPPAEANSTRMLLLVDGCLERLELAAGLFVKIFEAVAGCW